MPNIECENIGDWGRLYCGDWIEVMRTLPDNSIDSVITDPPAGIHFMGKKWDSDKGGRDKWIAWLTEGMRECLRILKPGGMALVWCIPRTAHWTATAVEDAGFEVRDKFYHLFGSGFPKSLDISKSIDKMKGAKREVIGTKRAGLSRKGRTDFEVFHKSLPEIEKWVPIEKSATPEAQRFDGYGTGLKPSVEEWILCMKKLDGTFAESALKWGVAGLAIDKSRIGTEPAYIDRPRGPCSPLISQLNGQGTKSTGGQGRWPSNLLLSHHELCREIGVKKVKGSRNTEPNLEPTEANSQIYGFAKYPKMHKSGAHYGSSDGTETVPAYECAAGCPCGHVWATKELTECPECGCRKVEWICPVALLDEMSGITKSTGGLTKSFALNHRVYGKPGKDKLRQNAGGLGDIGGASRYFKTFPPETSFQYAAKASRTEREQGLKGHIPCVKCNGLDTDWHLDERGERVKCVRNNHPTRKPLKIMEYLVRLTQTPNGGVVLDPFMGSGTTGIACVNVGRKFIGIDSDPKYIEIGRWAMETARKKRRGSFNLV